MDRLDEDRLNVSFSRSLSLSLPLYFSQRGKRFAPVPRRENGRVLKSRVAAEGLRFMEPPHG